MADITIWLDNSQGEPVKIVADERKSIHWLKNHLAKVSILPNFSDGRSFSQYQIVSSKTGLPLLNEGEPLYRLLKQGDHISIIADKDVITPETRPLVSPSADYSRTTDMEKAALKSSFLSVAAVNGSFPDLDKEYQVLAVAVKRTNIGQMPRRQNQSIFSDERIYLKESYFLVFDTEGRFRWLKCDASLRFGSSLWDWQRGLRKLNRYTVQKNIGERKNMIYPIRPFSITAINMDGFDRAKAYPVLAIDMDQYYGERQAVEPDRNEEIEPTGPSVSDQPESVAFFLVGDDNGEFAWIAEDECRLAPQ
jgi:hypothetical protein